MNALDLHSLPPVRNEADVGQSGAPARAIELREAAEQFEALFVQMMLKQARSTSLDEGGLFGDSRMDLAHELFDDEVAGRLSASGGLGLADMLVRQLTPQSDPELNPRIDRGQILAARPVAPTQTEMQTREVSSTSNFSGFDDGRKFVQTLLPLAREAAARLGVPAEAIVAQSVLETGWGKHIPVRADGSTSWNLFGIKADHRWQGERVSSVTTEVRDGIAQQEVASFRAYDSPAEAIRDYVDFIGNQSRYSEVTGHDDPRNFAEALQAAGYATDPDYAAKIERLARQVSGGAFPERIQEIGVSADV